VSSWRARVRAGDLEAGRVSAHTPRHTERPRPRREAGITAPWRVLTTILTLVLVTVPLAVATPQPREKVRVGHLSPGSASDAARQRRLEAFRQGLRDLGYVDGENIAIEARWADGKYDRYPALAADLVRLKVNVIVVVGGVAGRAAQQATPRIPIVMTVVIYPVGIGLVTSLAHPGGNVTGLSTMAPDMVGKQLPLLQEVVPKVSRVALLWNPDNAGAALQLRDAEPAARALGVRLQALEARSPQEIVNAFAAMSRERADAVVVLTDSIFTNQVRQIAELAAKKRLPAVHGLNDFTAAGGLMVYGPNPFDMERRAATFVDKILKGAKPGDLPVEQPAKFELVVNLKTAKALGLAIPPVLLTRADEIIQ
jgi:putative tryptophan/tyrosine transport system substrate-binding protein